MSALQPASDSVRLQIHEALGIPPIVLPEARTADVTGVPPPDEAPSEEATPTESPSGAPVAQDTGVASPPTATPEPRQVVASKMEPLIEEAGDRGAPAATLVQTPGDADEVALPFAPLLAPRSTRAILTAAIASFDPNGPPDLARIVEALGRRQPLVKLPRRWVRTMRRGVQVLVDASEAMTLFRRDQEAVLARIRQVAGPELVKVRHFTGCPSRPTRFGRRRGKVTYAYPNVGTPVLLLTDLGIGGIPAGEAGSVEEWLEFARNARINGCPVIALVPYAPARWPRPLTKAMTVVHWDRTTTAGSVRKRALEVHRPAPFA